MVKNVLITGVSGMYGRAFARYFLEWDYHVIGVDRRPQEDSYINSYAYHYRHIQQDIRFWRQQEYPQADIVFNNAAVGDGATDDEVIQTNLTSAIRISKHYAAFGAETIVNVCSDHAFYDSRGHDTYAAGKRGLVHFTQIASRQWPDTRWQALCPGNTHNPNNPIVENEHLPPWFFVDVGRVLQDCLRGIERRKVIVISGTHAKLVCAVHRHFGGKTFLRAYNATRAYFQTFPQDVSPRRKDVK